MTLQIIAPYTEDGIQCTKDTFIPTECIKTIDVAS